MGNISLKLNLAGLKHTVQKMKGANGEVEVLIIPIDANHLYRGEKGMYLDLQCIELKNPREGSKDTHLVKQSLPKDVYNAMSDEDKKAQPILGNAIAWGEGGGSSSTPEVNETKAGGVLPW
jgi:hypothetical protein